MNQEPHDVAWRIVRLDRQDSGLLHDAAQLLVDEFRAYWPEAWPDLAAAGAEVEEALDPAKLAFAAVNAGPGTLLGWIGAQPLYGDRVWELHPLVVAAAVQGRGIGRALVLRLEQEVRERGALTLWVGTDDEAGLTSLGGVDLYPGVVQKLAGVRNLRRHPMGFYQALSFEVAGVVPDANGFGKPDILMAKRVGDPRLR